MNHFSQQIVAYISAHPELAVLVIGCTSFGESFAFLSLLFPGTTILIAAGALMKVHAINPVWAAAAGGIGAILGDAISFSIGRRFGTSLSGMWPFRKHPAALEQAVAFFERFGWASVFIGRFFGPLRAVIPLAAGMLRMPVVPFYVANVLSAVVWAPALLLSGYLISTAATAGWTVEDKLFAGLLALAVIVAVIYAARRVIGVR